MTVIWEKDFQVLTSMKPIPGNFGQNGQRPEQAQAGRKKWLSGNRPWASSGSEAPPRGGACMLSSFSGVQLFETPWTVSCDHGFLQARILK